MAHDTGPPDPGRRMRGGPCQGRNTLKTAINGNQRDHTPIQPQLLEGGQEDLLRDHFARMNEAAGGRFEVTLIRPAVPQILRPAAVAAMESWFQWLRYSDAILTYCALCNSSFTWAVRLPHAFFFITPNTVDPEIGGITGVCAECAMLPDLELMHRASAFYGLAPLHKSSSSDGEGLPPPSGQPQGQEPQENFNASDPPAPQTCTVQAWLDRDLPEQDLLLGPLSTTTRAMLVAQTGIGKTNVAMGMAFSMATGKPFIHWYGHRSARVLFIDGEMSKRLLRVRIRDAARRLGKGVPEVPEGLYFLSRDDFEMMPPLNTRAGQQMIDKFIETIDGGIDFVFFDNVQALLLGDMKDEEPWQETLPWIRDLTRRSIGQLWVHHTGHDASRSYGTKTREWQLDAVMIAEAVERADSDIAFSLKFTKARERTPDNRNVYDPVTVILNNDSWTAEGGISRSKPPSPGGQKYYQALLNALADPNGSIVRVNGRAAVSMTAWKSECTRLRLIDPEDEANKQRADFSRYRRELIERDLIACQNELVWTVR